MKPIVIIIAGAKTKHPKWLDKFLEKSYYKYFGIETGEQGRAWVIPFKNYLEQHTNFDVSIFDWSGGISGTSMLLAAKRLAKMINDLPDDIPIYLFGKSLGGNVANLAIPSLVNNQKIRKIMYVATPHQPPIILLPKHIQLINIFSPQDNYITFANRTLFYGFGKVQMQNAINIALPNIRHGEFMKNVETVYEKKPIRTFDLYSLLLNK